MVAEPGGLPPRFGVGASWDAFAKNVIPAGAGAQQLSAMRKAFFAGAWSVLMLQREGSAALPPEAIDSLALRLEYECEQVLDGPGPTSP